MTRRMRIKTPRCGGPWLFAYHEDVIYDPAAGYRNTVILNGRSVADAVRLVLSEYYPYSHLISPHLVSTIPVAHTRVRVVAGEPGEWWMEEDDDGDPAVTIRTEPVDHYVIFPSVDRPWNRRIINLDWGGPVWDDEDEAVWILARTARPSSIERFSAYPPDRAARVALRAAKELRDGGGHAAVLGKDLRMDVDIRCPCSTCAPAGCVCAYCVWVREAGYYRWPATAKKPRRKR
jgi:hypothetical protein